MKFSSFLLSKQKIEELANLLKKEEVKPQESNRHAPQKHHDLRKLRKIRLFHWRYIQRIVMSRAAIFFCVPIVCEIVLPVGNGRSKG